MSSTVHVCTTYGGMYEWEGQCVARKGWGMSTTIQFVYGFAKLKPLHENINALMSEDGQ